mmetsp:Transcript_17955/g.31472  ORF Transcript_17955/g.31472 Transcript_17955/m.31472 type:complete len:676 (-) Transcript_17955:6-2033(-)
MTTSTNTSSERSGTPRVTMAISKTKETAKTAIDTTKKKTKGFLQDSKSTIEHNKWLLPLKWLIHFPRSWPRTSSFLLVVLWLWILILVSMGFGVLLAQYESPSEIADNDAILGARAQVAYFEVSRVKLLNVTNVCLARWEKNVLEGGTGGGTLEPILVEDTDLDDNETLAEIEDTNEAFLQQVDADGDGFVSINRTLLEDSLEDCTRSFVPELQAFQDATANNSIAFDSLSFNWNRCWNISTNSQFILHPTDAQKQAAHPSQQEAYYEQEWTEMQLALYEQYLPENPTEEEDYEAFLRSVQEATGMAACEPNMGGTAWFFFTIMTTVGYGNQAPVTMEGRTLVVVAGLFSLILFGAVLGLCGYTIVTIYDDFVSRCRWSKFLRNPVVGVFLWGLIWLLYALALAQDFQYWWEERLPEFYAELDRGDTLWFAWISTSTIGLGDFYLQPEIVFASDTLKYSVLYMIGFVLLSTFFGKIAETLSYLQPTQHNSLEARLANTRVLACWPRGFMPWESDEDETDEDDLIPDDQALIYRIRELKKLKPDPPKDDESARGLVSMLTGNAIRSMNVKLLHEEAALLQEWLAVVQFQEQRAKEAAEADDSSGESEEVSWPNARNEESGNQEGEASEETKKQENVTVSPPPAMDDAATEEVPPDANTEEASPKQAASTEANLTEK